MIVDKKENWQEFVLTDIADVFNGKTPSKAQQREHGHPVLKIKDVTADRKFKGKFKSFIDDSLAEKSRNKILKLHDTLILNAAHNADYVGSKQYKAEESVVGSLPTGEWLVARSKTDRLNPVYLNYWLRSESTRAAIKSLVKGIHLYPKDVARLKIQLPPLLEQEKIARILDAADSLRQKDQLLTEYYNMLSQSLFFDMFGEPLTNSMEWEVKLLKDLSVKIHSGATPKGGSKVYVEKGIVLLRSQNVLKNKIKLDDAVYIDKDTHYRMRKSSLKNRDILMTKTGRVNTENSSLGRAAMFLGEEDSANVNGHVYLIRLQEDVVNEFILFILTTIEYREYIRRISVGGIDKRQINKEHLEKFPIINPPIELQKKFVERLAAIEAQKKLAQQNLEKSEELFNSLLKKGLKGELTS